MICRDIDNIFVTNKKLKGFKYSKEEVEPLGLIQDSYLTVNALEFYRVVEYLHKTEKTSFELYTDKNILGLRSNGFIKAKIELPLVDFDGVESSCYYAVEFILKFLKSYTIKELRERNLNIEFSTDFPIKLTLGDSWIMIAPRIRQEE